MKDYQKLMSDIGKKLMSTIAMGVYYENWSEEFSYRKIRESYFGCYQSLNELIGDITKLSIE